MYRGLLLVLFLSVAGSASAGPPVVVDRDAVLTQFQTLAATIGNLQNTVDVAARKLPNKKQHLASMAALHDGLGQVAAQLQQLDGQVRNANPPIEPQACPQVVCPPAPTCAPCPSCPELPPPPPPGYGEPPWPRYPREDRRAPRNVAPVPMTEGELSEVLGAINGESFSDGKLRVLGDFAPARIFTCDQAIRVIGAFSFSADKLGALRIMKPRILDRQNQFRIYGAFTFSSDKDEARRIMETP